MYSIERKPHGIKLVFGDFIKKSEMEAWVSEFCPMVDSMPEEFTVFVDMRTLKPLPQEAQPAMEKGQKYARENGMVRSVVILNSAVTTMQFKRIAKQTGIYQWERYIDAEATPNWEQVGMDWLVRSIDPDA